MVGISHHSLHTEIPGFLKESIICCNNLVCNKNDISCLILVKNLKLYELNKRNVLFADLSKTCLSKLEEAISSHDGNKCRWLGNKIFHEEMSISTPAITFGKYIYQNFEINKLYILLQCWSKMVVLKRSSGDYIQVIAEYENVESFCIVPSEAKKYQATVKIQFKDGTYIHSDFQKNEIRKTESNNTKRELYQRKREFKNLMERIRTIKAELQIHKEISRQQYLTLEHTQAFGENFLRSCKLDEKPMLTRCGDVWARIVECSDTLVLGIPLISNNTSSNLTTLVNLHPVLSFGEPSSEKQDVMQGLNFQHRIYQLKQSFEHLESVESFLKIQMSLFEESTWTNNDNNQIFPTSFVVLLIKWKLSQIALLEKKCRIFLRFEVKKDLGTAEPKTKTFEQHIFIKCMDFSDILKKRKLFEINFGEYSLHQDFLAVVMSSCQTHSQIEFHTPLDLYNFESYLVSKLDFEIIRRQPSSDNSDDEDAPMKCQNFPNILYYNRKPNSVWYGCLVLHEIDKKLLKEEGSLKTHWIFYNKSEDHAFLMFKAILSELVTFSTNVVSVKIKSGGEKREKLTDLENSMRHELKIFLDLSNSKRISKLNEDKFKWLMKLQLFNDCQASEV